MKGKAGSERRGLRRSPRAAQARRVAYAWPWPDGELALAAQKEVAASAETNNRDFTEPEFDELIVALPADVRGNPAKSASITVTAEPKVLAVISVKQTGRQILITTQGSFQTQKPVTIEVSTPTLSSLDVSNAGEVSVTGPFGPNLLLRAQDASVVSLTQLNLQALDVDLRGSAELIATGQSGKLQLKAEDASSFDGSSLELKDAQMTVSGASEATVYASSTLSVKITETGSVYYSGSPSIEQSVSFAGTLEAQ